MTSNAALTEVARRIILDAPLVDTGALAASIAVSTEVDAANGIVHIDVYSLPYLVYHFNEIRFAEKFTSSPAFTEALSAMYAPMIEKRVVDSLQSGADFDFVPRVKMTFRS